MMVSIVTDVDQKLNYTCLFSFEDFSSEAISDWGGCSRALDEEYVPCKSKAYMLSLYRNVPLIPPSTCQGSCDPYFTEMKGKESKDDSDVPRRCHYRSIGGCSWA